MGYLCHLCTSFAVAVQSNVSVSDSLAPGTNVTANGVFGVVGRLAGAVPVSFWPSAPPSTRLSWPPKPQCHLSNCKSANFS